MLETFPLHIDGWQLDEADFSLFAAHFRQRIAEEIPCSGGVHFLQHSDALPKLSANPLVGNELAARFRHIVSREEVACKVASHILIAFPVRGGQQVIALISEVDGLVIERSAVDWLIDVRDRLVGRFLQLKEWYTDLETGLLNSSHLFDMLSSVSGDSSIAVFLVSMPPKSGMANEAFRHAQRAAKALLSFTSRTFSLHHLGQSLFALLVPEVEIGSTEQFSARLAQLLRRDTFAQVHIGSSLVTAAKTNTQQVLDEAWTALQTASRRGPLAFCDYSFLASAASHPLRPVEPGLMERYRNISRKSKQFAIIQFHEGCGTDSLSRQLPDAMASFKPVFLGKDGGEILFVEGVTGEEALAVARRLLAGMPDEGGGGSRCCGVSCFPFHTFSRSETILNSRKAVLHAELLGPGNSVLFDAVSLNVSGDIHFGDGDLACALKEYRRGAAVDPGDVNLLNSLGVTYALLNQQKAAQAAFSRALEQDGSNTLALYNLGLGAQQTGNMREAVSYFEKARLACQMDDDAGVCQEVELHLGRLYCQEGRFEESLECLTSWFNNADIRQQARVFRYLGEAYLGVNQPREAMLWLQRAMRHNEYDHETLSLLGNATWQAREGDDIALTFCQKSVDLSPNDARLRLRLAALQLELGQPEKALENLLVCRVRKDLLTEVQLAKARAYLQLGDVGGARRWGGRALKRSRPESALHVQAGMLLKSIEQEAAGHGIQ